MPSIYKYILLLSCSLQFSFSQDFFGSTDSVLSQFDHENLSNSFELTISAAFRGYSSSNFSEFMNEEYSINQPIETSVGFRTGYYLASNWGIRLGYSKGQIISKHDYETEVTLFDKNSYRIGGMYSPIIFHFDKAYPMAFEIDAGLEYHSVTIDTLLERKTYKETNLKNFSGPGLYIAPKLSTKTPILLNCGLEYRYAFTSFEKTSTAFHFANLSLIMEMGFRIY